MKATVAGGRFRESTSDSEADGGVTLPGFLEPFVETVISGLRLGNDSREEVLAYYDLAVDAG